MNVTRLIVLLIAGFIIFNPPAGAAEEAAPAPVPPEAVSIEVMDIVLLSTNRVAIGTNTMSVAEAAVYLSKNRKDLDVAAVHPSVAADFNSVTNHAMWSRLLEVGVPLMVVEKDGEYALRKHTEGDGTRSVSLGTGQLAVFQRLWRHGNKAGTTSALPALQATADWDATTGEYGISKMELGLFGKKVWVVQEEPESENEEGATGIKFKKAW